MKVIDLFSGIGGFSLGLESTGGFETVQFVEYDKWCQKILAKNFPNVPITGDIRNYEGQRADVVTGGFPCQPFSVAGKRKGTDDNRHLWPEMLRVIKASKPRWVIGENVRNLTSIQEGMVFEQVCTDLENEGYEVQSFIIPASAVEAPHQRYRVWIVGYSKHNGSQDRCEETRGEKRESEQGRMLESERTSTQQNVADSESSKSRKQTEWERGKDTERGSDDSRRVEREGSANVADTQCDGLTPTEKRGSIEETIRQESQGKNRTLDSQGASGLSETTRNVADSESNKQDGIPRETKSEHDKGNSWVESKCRSNRQSVGDTEQDVANSDSKRQQEQWGESSVQQNEQWEAQRSRLECENWWSIEPNVGRVAHGIPNRVDRLKGLGNAIVPQIAYQIGLAILEAEKESN
jgi:DNA (cytosine-5)-methyltransferase 1